MSGLGEFGGLPGFVTAGNQVQVSDVDQLIDLGIDNPSVSNTWIGTAAGGTNAQTKALVLINKYCDWPRNLLYSVVGTNDVGGTWTVNGRDQFGNAVTETAGFGTKAMGTPAGSVFGTTIFSRVDSGTFTFAVGSAGNGSAQVGFGTLSNGSAQSNWFGLLTRIAGTNDVKALTWITTNTPTTLNGGTALGTLVGYDGNGSLPYNAFQGTSGVAVTDHYKVFVKSTFNNIGRGNMINS